MSNVSAALLAVMIVAAGVILSVLIRDGSALISVLGTVAALGLMWAALMSVAAPLGPIGDEGA